VRTVQIRRFVSEACDGPFGSAIKTEHYADTGARVVRLGNIGDGEWRDTDQAFLTLERFGDLARHDVRADDLLIAGLGDDRHPVGRAAVAPAGISPALVKADCYRLRLFGAHPKFVAYALSSTFGRAQSMQLADGSTRRRLTLGKALSLRVPEIPLAEQRAIADYLDAETARIDALIAKKQQLIHLLEERAKGRVEEGIRQAGADYGFTPLKHAVDNVQVGIVITPAKWYAEDGVPAIRGVNVSAGAIDMSDSVFLTAEGHAHNSKSTIRHGDLVVVRTGQAGAAAVVPQSLDGANCIDLLIIRPNGSVSSAFLELVMNSDWTAKHVDAHSVGSIQSHFNVGALKDVEVPMVNSTVQPELVGRLRAQLAVHAALVRKLNRQIALLTERRQALITAAVTGEFAVPGAA